MGRIFAVENLSLDGVMQAPGDEDEDRRDGFLTTGAIIANYEVIR